MLIFFCLYILHVMTDLSNRDILMLALGAAAAYLFLKWQETKSRPTTPMAPPPAIPTAIKEKYFSSI